MLIKNAGDKDQAQVISDGNKGSTGTGIDVMCLKVWQKICPHFDHVLRCSVSLRFRVVG